MRPSEPHLDRRRAVPASPPSPCSLEFSVFTVALKRENGAQGVHSTLAPYGIGAPRHQMIPDTNLDLSPSVKHLLQHACRLSVIQPSEATPAIHWLAYDGRLTLLAGREGSGKSTLLPSARN